MNNNEDVDVFIKHLPAFKVWYVVVLSYLLQFLLFVFFIISFGYVSYNFLPGVIVVQIIVAFFGTLPYRYMTKNSEKIRESYLKKYSQLAVQKLWFHYELYTIPFLSSSLYFPLLLINYDFIPSIVTHQPHFLTNSLFPLYTSIPIGIVILILGIRIGRPSGGFDANVESYMYIIYPEKGKLISDGTYQYIRHPRYLGRGVIAFGLAIIANNILALLVAAIHTVAFWSLIPSEEYELARRFGDKFGSYTRRVPALIPKYSEWKKFIRYIFYLQKN